MNLKLLVIASATAILTACGSGSSDSTVTPIASSTPTAAQMHYLYTGEGPLLAYAFGANGVLSLASTTPLPSTSAAGFNIFTPTPSGQYIFATASTAVASVCVVTVNGSACPLLPEDPTLIDEYAVSTTGVLTLQSSFHIADGIKPLSITITPSGQFAYILASATDGTTSLYEYTVASNGTLSLTGKITGVSASNIVIDSASKYAYAYTFASNNTMPSTITEYMIGTNGTLSPMSTPTVTIGLAPDYIALSPSGQYLYATSYNNNQIATISGYPIANGVVSASPTFTLPSGALQSLNNPPTTTVGTIGESPIQLLVDPTGKYVYVLDTSLTSTVWEYAISTDGSLSFVSTLSLPQMNVPITTETNGEILTTYQLEDPLILNIGIDPTGQYMYMNSAASGTILQYAIGSNGMLSPVTTPTVQSGGGALLNIS